MFTMIDSRRQAIKGIMIVQLSSETGLMGLLSSAFTGRPTTFESVVITGSSAASVCHAILLVDDSLVLVVLVDKVISSVSAFVVVELVVWRVEVELVVVDDMVDCKVVVGKVVGGFVAVVVGFRLHRGSLLLVHTNILSFILLCLQFPPNRLSIEPCVPSEVAIR